MTIKDTIHNRVNKIISSGLLKEFPTQKCEATGFTSTKVNIRINKDCQKPTDVT